MIVVADTSCLIALARINKLDLLHQLYGTILVPEAVWHEATDFEEKAGSVEISRAAWLQKRSIEHQLLFKALRQNLGVGEAEAIVLALEVNADLLIMDERSGRETARFMGLQVVGVIGILIEAKQRGLLQQIRPVLDALRNQAGFWMKDSLYERVLRDAGEWS